MGNELARLPGTHAGRDRSISSRAAARSRTSPTRITTWEPALARTTRDDSTTRSRSGRRRSASSPDYAEAHYNLATAYSRASRPVRRTRSPNYQAALRIRPDYADAHNNLGSVYSQLPARLPDALAEYQAALRLHPDDANAHLSLGKVLSAMPGRMPEADRPIPTGHSASARTWESRTIAWGWRCSRSRAAGGTRSTSSKPPGASIPIRKAGE